jgi:2-iminobutanoate/2-iminopropanoate deaminase
MTDPTPQFGPYSPVRRAGDYYFVSGQVGVDAAKHAEADVAHQASQALENLRAVLNGAGLTPADVVKTTVFLKHMSDFDAVNEIYTGFFSDPRPARSCVEVASLPQVADNELSVEIEATAYKGASS